MRNDQASEGLTRSDLMLFRLDLAEMDSGSQINKMEGQRDRAELVEGRRELVHEITAS